MLRSSLRVLARAALVVAALACEARSAAAQSSSASPGTAAAAESDSAILIRLVETIESGDSARIAALRGRYNATVEWWATIKPALVDRCWIDRRNAVICARDPRPLAESQAHADALSRLVTTALGPRGWSLAAEYPGRGAILTRRYASPERTRAVVRMTQLTDGARILFALYPPPAAPPQ